MNKILYKLEHYKGVYKRLQEGIQEADEVFERIQNEYVTLFGNLLSEMERRA